MIKKTTIIITIIIKYKISRFVCIKSIVKSKKDKRNESPMSIY